MNEPNKSNWKTEPWFWFVWALPASAVVASLITLAIAVKSFDGVVMDDYYRKGKEINRVIARDKMAKELGLGARVNADLEQRVLRVSLYSNKDATVLPKSLQVSLWHATMGGLDRVSLMANPGIGEYTIPLEPLHDGHWYIHLETREWRLVGSINVPGEMQTTLSSQ